VKPLNLTPRREPLKGCYVIDLANYNQKSADVKLISGLGYDWQVVQLGDAVSNPVTDGSSYIEYTFPAVSRDTVSVKLYTVPFWPLFAGRTTQVAISVDGATPQVFDNQFKEYSREWKDQVMRNGALCQLRFPVNKSRPSHTLRISTIEPGQMVQRITIDWGGLHPAYIGPSK
jgi:hypothetical protein